MIAKIGVYGAASGRLFVVALLAGVLAASGCGGGEEPKPDGGNAAKSAGDPTAENDPANPEPVDDPFPADDPVPPPPNDGPATPLTMVELNAAENSAADFGGKRVELTGLVVVPGRGDLSGGLVVMLNEDGGKQSTLSKNNVNAIFPAPGEARLRTLAPSQPVTVSGRLQNVSGNVWQLDEATLVSTGDDPTTAVTATELTQAFVDDEDAAAGTYRDESLKVTGTVAEGTAKFGKYLAVPLEGADKEGRPTRVLALLDPAHFWKYGTEPPTADTLKARNLFEVGSEATFYGRLQLAEFGNGPDGNLGLPLEGYPAEWRE